MIKHPNCRLHVQIFRDSFRDMREYLDSLPQCNIYKSRLINHLFQLERKLDEQLNPPLP